MFGWKEGEVKGKLIDIIIAPEHREAHRKGMDRLKITGHSKILDKPMEVNGWHRFEESIPISLIISQSSIGGVIHYTGIIKNITEKSSF